MPAPTPKRITAVAAGAVTVEGPVDTADATWIEFADDGGSFAFSYGTLLHRGERKSFHALGISPALTGPVAIVRLIAGQNVFVKSRDGTASVQLHAGGSKVAELRDGDNDGQFLQTIEFEGEMADIIVLAPGGEPICTEPTCPVQTRVRVNG